MRLRILVILALLAISVPQLRAQKLPALPKASEITVGTLPNKVSYYLVNNTAAKGYADFALVQKGRSDKDASRADLSSLPHFPGSKPYEFLARKGVGYSRSGFISYLPEAVVFRFEDVPVFDSAASDSTLLMVFDLIGRYPAEQALVISGDISALKYPDKLKTLSLFITPRQKAPATEPYIWNPTDSLHLRFSPNPTADVASMEVTYRIQRVDQKYMNTPAPLVSEMFARELASIIRKRTVQAFRAAGMPLAGFSARYRPSAASSSDELFSIRVTTSRECLEDATVEIARILAHIDEQGVALDEYLDARDRLSSEAIRDAGNRPVTNRQYVSRCIASWLYGAHLASAATVNEFFARRTLTPEHEQAMFNRFCSALLSATGNLTIHYDTPSDGEDRSSLAGTFRQAWTYARLDTLDRVRTRINYGDTLGLTTTASRVKAWRAVKEPITGGEFWNFSNGTKVIFKRTSLKNEFRYAFLIKGGFTSVSGLLPGESSFVGDMLRLYDVAGMSGVDFRNMLRANGISMEEQVTVSDLRICGNAPSTKLHLLMKSALSLANDRKLNRSAFEYYRGNEALRLQQEKFTVDGINAVMDSIICPEYLYPDHKSMDSLRDDLPERADVYFNKQFRNFSDGVLVLIGDLDPYETRKVLSQYLGGFKTTRGRAVRPNVEFPMRTGWSTYTVDSAKSLVGDGEPCVNVALSALVPFSMDRYMSFKIARVAFEKQIVRRLAAMGMYAEVTDAITIMPVERMSIFINCWQCSDDGLPSDIVPADPLTALGAVRSALSDVSSSKISAAELKGYKADLLNRIQSEFSRPDVLTDAVLMRYSAGKDIVSDYKSHVNAVSEASVKEIINALEMGSKVEYIIK